MGKGDKKSRRGKIVRGTYGNLRLRKKKKVENIKSPKKKNKFNGALNKKRTPSCLEGVFFFGKSRIIIP